MLIPHLGQKSSNKLEDRGHKNYVGLYNHSITKLTLKYISEGDIL